MIRRNPRMVLSLLLVALTGCHDFRMHTPANFVELEYTEYDYQAIDPDGVVLAVRAVDTQGAQLSFWQKAVKNQLSRLGAYELKAERSVRSADGTPGLLLEYERLETGRSHNYAVALFIKSDRLFVVESGGPSEAYAARSKEIEQALSRLEL